MTRPRITFPHSFSLCLPFLALLLLLGAPPPAQAGHANLFLGAKALDENDWAPLDSQTEVGVEASWGGQDWPVLIATDLLGSASSENVLGIDIEGSTGELDLGVRKIWNTGGKRRVHPHLGGGIAYLSAKFEGASGGVKVSDDDTGVGVWLGGGIFWRLGTRFNLGMSARVSTASVTLYDVDGDAGGGHFGLILGWGWPAE